MNVTVTHPNPAFVGNIAFLDGSVVLGFTAGTTGSIDVPPSAFSAIVGAGLAITAGTPSPGPGYDANLDQSVAPLVGAGASATAAALRAALDARLAVATTITANATASLDTYHPVNATGGAVTLALPTGAAQGSVIVVEKEDASANAVTLTGTIRGTPSSSVSLVWQYESLTLTADTTGAWWPRAGHKTKTSLDAAYVGKSSQPVSVLDFGAVADGSMTNASGTDNTTAFNNALATGRPVWVPAGTYRITGLVTLNGNTMIGAGVGKTIIMQTTQANPILQVLNINNVLSDMRLTHFALPDGTVTVPNGVGIRCERLGIGTVIERIEVYNSTSALYSYEPITQPTNYVVSATIRDFRASRFTHSAVYMRGSGAGNTGIILENIYANNVNPDSSYGTTTYGFHLQDFNEIVCLQLNLEATTCNIGVEIIDTWGSFIRSVHFEKYTAAGSSGSAFFNIAGSLTKNVDIGTVTFLNCTYDSSKLSGDYSLVRLQASPTVMFRGINTTTLNTVGSAINKYRAYLGTGLGNGAALLIDGYSDSGGYFGGGFANIVTVTPPCVRRYNDQIYFQEQSFPTASRPSASGVGVGVSIWDSTLNKPIWSTGSAWIDATGTTV